MKRKTSKRTAIAAFCLSMASVCIVVLVILLVLIPQHKEISDIEGRIRDIIKEQEKPGKNGHKSDLSALQEELSSAQENLARYVVSPQQASDLPFKIRKIAETTKVTELKITNNKQSSYGPINECRLVREGRIQVNFKSSFLQFAEFINALERHKPVIFVDYFKIRRSGKEGTAHDVEMVLTFFVRQDSLKV